MTEPAEPTKTNEQDAARDRALRDLERLNTESESLGTSSFVRQANMVRDGKLGSHLSAADADQDDQIELWGQRIGRGLGLLAAIGLLIYLVFTYLF